MEAPPLKAPLQDSHDSHRVLRPGHVHVARPHVSARRPLLERSRPHSTPGLTPRAHEKAQAPEEVSGYIHLWSRCLHHTSGHWTPECFPAQVLEAHRRYLSRLAWFICCPESRAASYGQNTKILRRWPQPSLLPAGFLLQLSHLCTWPLPGSTVPSHQAGSGRSPAPGTEQVLKDASMAEAAADEIQGRFRSTRCLSSQQPTGDPCRGAAAFPSSKTYTVTQR